MADMTGVGGRGAMVSSKEEIFKEQEERKEKKTCVGLCYLTKVQFSQWPKSRAKILS